MIDIIGTSHIAKQSIKEIKEKIQKDKPEIVAVELDVHRMHALSQREQRIRWKDAWRLGLFGFIFAKIGAWIQGELGRRVGILPGSDMKAAVEEARKIKAKIYLIDRPLPITLQRLSKNMPAWEKLRLFGYILFGGFYPENRKLLKKINLTRVPSDRVIEKMTGELKEKFPMLYKILIEERNRYMADQLLRIRSHFPEKKILAVVGAGHLKELKGMLT